MFMLMVAFSYSQNKSTIRWGKTCDFPIFMPPLTIQASLRINLKLYSHL